MAPHLPPELMDHILSYAVPLPTRYSGPTRAQLLCILSLVNQQWRVWAQARLIQHVTLSSRRQACDLAKLFDQGTFDPLHVRTLVLNTPFINVRNSKFWGTVMNWGIGRDALFDVVRRMARVQVVWTSAVGAGEKDLDRLLSCFQDLKSIRILHPERQHTQFDPPSRRSTFSITSISFSSNTSILSFIPPQSLARTGHPAFPNVTHLSLSHTGDGIAVPMHNFEVLAPQLVSLLISMKRAFNTRKHLKCCTKLKTLFLDTLLHVPSLRTLLDTLPPSVTKLHLAGSQARIEEIGCMRWTDYVRNWKRGKWEGRLERVVLWPRLGDEVDTEDVAELKEILGCGGVQLVVASKSRGEVVAEDWDPNEF